MNPANPQYTKVNNHGTTVKETWRSLLKQHIKSAKLIVSHSSFHLKICQAFFPKRGNMKVIFISTHLGTEKELLDYTAMGIIQFKLPKLGTK